VDDDAVIWLESTATAALAKNNNPEIMMIKVVTCLKSGKTWKCQGIRQLSEKCQGIEVKVREM